MNEMDNEQKRRFDAFRRFVIPLAGVAEAIATQGKSPGTTAMNVENIYQGQEDRSRQFQRQAEQDALQRKLAGATLKGAEREEEKYGREKGSQDEWRSVIEGLPGLSEIEKITLKGVGAEKGIPYIMETKAGNRSGFTGWRERSKDWDEISAIPEGPEKQAAIESYLYKWAPSVGYSSSPAAINQSVKKAVAVGEGTLPIKVETAKATAKARVTGEAAGTKRVPDKTRESLTEDYNNIQNLKRVSEKFDPKFVGPVKGRAGDMSEWLGTMGVDEKVFRAEVQNYVDRLIKSTTGAQMSEPEAKRIMRETVNFNTNPKAYFATLDSNIETIEMRMKGVVKGLKATNFDIGGLEDLESGRSGLTEEKRLRLEKLRAKKAAGTLGR